jgi:AcrR family transcriptional regulator
MITRTVISSRERILSSGKTLFARYGYENTSTVAIARDASTSESQLMKHFGSKLGLLSAICEQGWTNILQRAHALVNGSAATPKTLVDVLESLMIELERDPEMKSVLILESRRVGKDGSELSPARGGLQFGAFLEELLTDFRNRGALPAGISVKAARAALFGMMEGMILDEVVSTRNGGAASYASDEARTVLETVVSGLVAEPGFSRAERRASGF